MGRIEWSGEMALGLPSMDMDHRRLLALGNEFMAAAEASEPFPRLARLMGELIARARVHFQAEETLLDRAAYPGLAAHRAEHERLLVEAQRLYERLLSPLAADHPDHHPAEQAAAYLQRRLVEHVLGEDRGFRSYVMRLA